LRPFRWRQGFEFGDDFLRAHGCNYPRKFVAGKRRIARVERLGEFPAPWDEGDVALKSSPRPKSGAEATRRHKRGTQIAELEMGPPRTSCIG
jgi:hypothetical protein